MKKTIKFKQFCEQYLSTRMGAKFTTIKTYKSVIDTHLIPELGNVSVNDLNKDHGLKVMNNMTGSDRSKATTNKAIVILKCIVDFAVEKLLIKENKLSSIKLLKDNDKSFCYWNEKEAHDFLEAIQGHKLHDVFKFALSTGLRRGEICGLLWENVKHTENGTELHFGEQLLPGRIRGTVKSGKKRYVPLSNEAINVLNNINKKGDKDYIFTLKNGKSIEPNYLSIEFRSIQKKIGIKNSINFHAMRHSFASLLSSKGVNIQKIQHLLGHANSSMTERYSHLNQNDLRDAAQMVSFGK